MSNDDDKEPEDPAEAIEWRIERLRRMRGWTSDAPKDEPAKPDPTAKAPKAEPSRAVVHAETEKPQERPEDTLWLRYVDPSRGRTEIEVDRDHFEIGSGERVHLRIMDPSLSARHCRISWDDGGYRVRDMNSKSGTFVNGQAVPLSHPIKNGDVLRIGQLEFDVTVRSADAGAGAEKTAFVAVQPSPMTRPAPPPVVAPAPAPRPAPTPTPRAEAPRPVVEPQIVCYVLLHRDANGQPIETRILKGQSLLIGRAAAANLRLSEGSVSNRHCTVSWGTDPAGSDAERPVVKDLGSSNGTFVNDARITQSELKDGDAFQLGRYPMRVGVIRMAPAPPPEPEVIEEEEEVAEVAPPSFHVVYLDEHGTMSVVTLSEHAQLIGVGSASDIQAPATFGLLGEHATFTWDQGVLLVEAVDGELVTVDGAEVQSAVLKNGDVVALGPPDQPQFKLRVVRSLPTAVHKHESPNIEATVAAWAQLLQELDADLELQFIDPAGIIGSSQPGRVELVLWGDGVIQLDVKHGGETVTSVPGRMHRDVLLTLAGALTRAGFPDTHHAGDGPTGRGKDPEVHIFRGKHRADIVIGQRLSQRSGAYTEVRDLLRAIAAEIATD
ncbi:MAG: FHA domain-containing protein [Deltaproteobacteria bacterium]|nr:FHA domain-containing protein [Deltaproteobacteria bacterium]